MGSIMRAERTPSIVSANKLARALGTTLAGLFAELEQEGSGNSNYSHKP